jgi:hypothetical protein
MSRALNHEGAKGYTQVKRALVRQTGIKYGLIGKAVKTIKAGPASLTFTIEAKGEETNIGLFGARQGKKGVSAAPWNKRHVFKSTFMVGKYGDKVYRRTGKTRLPIKPVYGPNIAREIVKDETAKTFNTAASGIADRVAHEIDHFLRT